MNEELKQHFIRTLLRFQKVDVCPCSKGDTHYTELVILSSVAYNCPAACGNLNVSQVKDMLHISQSAVSQALNSLEKKGYITRNIDAHDRRKISISVTDQGHAVLEITTSHQEKLLDEVFIRFGIADIELLVQLLERLFSVYKDLKNNDWRDEQCP